MDNVLCFIYGASIMFYISAIRVFFPRKKENLIKIALCMLVFSLLGCIKDIILLAGGSYEDISINRISVSIDMFVVPLYALLLYELSHPGEVTRKGFIQTCTPFAALSIFNILFNFEPIYHLYIGFSILFIVATIVLFILSIPKYNKKLKQQFSYTDNLSLSWLYKILILFCVLASIWILSCTFLSQISDLIFLASNILIWSLFFSFLYKHEYIISSLEHTPSPLTNTSKTKTLWKDIEKLFHEDKIYLNPKLSLNDLATILGTNRTYLSKCINNNNNNFFNFVNNFRLIHAEEMLRESNYPITQIAEESGFNSISTFRRCFIEKNKCTPAEYRNKFTN